LLQKITHSVARKNTEHYTLQKLKKYYATKQSQWTSATSTTLH